MGCANGGWIWFPGCDGGMAACMPFIAALPHAADHFSFVTRGGGGFVGGVAGVMDYWFSGMMVTWAGMWACRDLQGILA